MARYEQYEPGDYWANAEHLWNNMGFGAYELTANEHRQGFQYFSDFLRDIDNLGMPPQASLAYWDFLNYFGMEEEDFDWYEFRDWYSAH